jgi:hypothetical protein
MDDIRELSKNLFETCGKKTEDSARCGKLVILKQCYQPRYKIHGLYCFEHNKCQTCDCSNDWDDEECKACHDYRQKLCPRCRKVVATRFWGQAPLWCDSCMIENEELIKYQLGRYYVPPEERTWEKKDETK